MHERVRVRATAADGRVVLWERDAEHPGGEVFLAADGRVVEAGLTPAVAALLSSGALEMVGDVGAQTGMDSAEAGDGVPAPVVLAEAGDVGAQTGSADSAGVRPNRRKRR